MNGVKAPDLIAHRGWASRFPENTLMSLSGALDVGARFVEFDVQLSADDTPVLLHDATLDRTSPSTGCVHDLPWPTLGKTSVGEPERFGNAFGEALVPSLRQALDLLRKWPGRHAFVEIKTESLQRFGIGRVLQRCLPFIRQAPGQCIVTSYSDELLEAVRETTDLPVAWVLKDYDEASLTRAGRLRPEYLFCNVNKLPETGPLEAGPWHWAVYEITEPDLALAIAGRGAALIETMAIGEMLSSPALQAARALE